MSLSSTSDGSAYEPNPDRAVAIRVVPIVAALCWGVLLFGNTDLLVVPLRDERFSGASRLCVRRAS